MFKIVEGKDEWQKALNRCHTFDTYHTWEYHHLYPEIGAPKLLVYSKEDDFVALPIIVRGIPNTDYKDITSVYGYAGPLSNINPETFDSAAFAKDFHSFLSSENVVSVFARLHPFIDHQDILLQGLGGLENLGNVVYVNLKEEPEVQRAKYNKRLKTQINKLRKEFDVFIDNSMEAKYTFREVYEENMRRVGASPKYFFHDSYYEKLTATTDFETDTFLIRQSSSNKIVSAGILFRKNGIAQYHLSGTLDEFLSYSPAKLLIDEMRLHSNATDSSIFNLGGGKGGENDSLFSFKSLFSKTYRSFHVWKYIVLPEVYDELSRKQHVEETNSAFFPLYRYEKEVL